MASFESADGTCSFTERCLNAIVTGPPIANKPAVPDLEKKVRRVDHSKSRGCLLQAFRWSRLQTCTSAEVKSSNHRLATVQTAELFFLLENDQCLALLNGQGRGWTARPRLRWAQDEAVGFQTQLVKRSSVSSRQVATSR
jgi:hypothetical protein